MTRIRRDRADARVGRAVAEAVALIALGTPASAQALTCEDVGLLMQMNVPSDVVDGIIAAASPPLAPTELACVWRVRGLAEGGPNTDLGTARQPPAAAPGLVQPETPGARPTGPLQPATKQHTALVPDVPIDPATLVALLQDDVFVRFGMSGQFRTELERHAFAASREHADLLALLRSEAIAMKGTDQRLVIQGEFGDYRLDTLSFDVDLGVERTVDRVAAKAIDGFLFPTLPILMADFPPAALAPGLEEDRLVVRVPVPKDLALELERIRGSLELWIVFRATALQRVPGQYARYSRYDSTPPALVQAEQAVRTSQVRLILWNTATNSAAWEVAFP